MRSREPARGALRIGRLGDRSPKTNRGQSPGSERRERLSVPSRKQPSADHCRSPPNRRNQGPRGRVRNRPIAYAESVRTLRRRGRADRPEPNPRRSERRQCNRRPGAGASAKGIVGADGRRHLNAAAQAADRGLLQHAYTGHGDIMASSHHDQQRHRRRSCDSFRRQAIVRFESAAKSRASVAVSGHCRFLLDGVEMLVVARTRARVQQTARRGVWPPAKV
jgi:hypothetical protein